MVQLIAARNASGAMLAVSGAGKTGFSGSKAAEILNGTAGNDIFRGGGGGDTLTGGKGDDTYYVYDNKDVVIEKAGEGVDTVNSTVSYTLSANVENLIVSGANTFGGGNALDNLIMGDVGDQTLDGGAGNDVLTGGAGHDVFVLGSGGGRDVITDFTVGDDMVQLKGLGVTSFAQVQGLMTQQGANVVLTAPTGEQLVFQNHKIADFGAGNFQLSLDISNLKLTFADEFDSLSLINGGKGAGTWRTDYGYGGYAAVGAHTLATNGEQQIYVDPNFKGTSNNALGLNPFSINNGVLDITAQKLSAADSANLWGYQYSSGLLTSKNTFAQQYGYFEVSAKLPAGQGMWPAFWLLPANGSWPPEIDIFEQLGNDTSTLYTTVHSNAAGKHVTNSSAVHVDDASAAFHTYGLMWDQNYLVYYVDRVEVARKATPADANQPMYILLNLAVGGSWPGNPDATTKFPSTMSIDYVHVYSLANSPTTTTSSSPAPVVSAPAPVVTPPVVTPPVVTPPVVTVPTPAPVVPSAAVSASGLDVTSSATYVLAGVQANLTLSGTAAINGTGNDLDNHLYGNSASNTLTGGLGNDTLDGGAGADKMVGGVGNDIYIVDNVGDQVTEAANQGVDLVKSSITYTLGANVENLYLTGTAAINGTGNALDNYIVGNGAANVLTGGDGADTLDGGGGADTLIGGNGNDIYLVDNVNESIVEAANGGVDLVKASVTWTLGANVENLTLVGTAAINGTGNALNNIIIGNSANNVLNGGAGNDTLDGGAGNDTLTGGLGKDTFVLKAGGGHDVVTDFNLAQGDLINLSAFKGQAAPTFVQQGADTIIEFSTGEWLTLLGIKATDPNLASHIIWN